MSIGGSLTQSLSSLIQARPNGALFGVDAGLSVFATHSGELGGWNPATMPLTDSGVIQNLTQGFSALSLVANELNASELPIQLNNAIDVLTFDQGGRKEQQVLGNLEEQIATLCAQLPMGSDERTQMEANLHTVNTYQKGLKINEYTSKRATSFVLTELNTERQVAAFLRANETHPLINQVANAELQRREQVVQALDVLAKTSEVGLKAAFLDPSDPQYDNVEYSYNQLSDLYDEAELNRFEVETRMAGLMSQVSGGDSAAEATLPALGRVYRLAAHIALIGQLDDVENQRLSAQIQWGNQAVPASLQSEQDTLTEWLNNDTTMDSVLDRAPSSLQSVQLGLLDAQRRSGYFSLAKLKGWVDTLTQSLLMGSGHGTSYEDTQAQLDQLNALVGQTSQQINGLYLQEQGLVGQFGSWRG